VRYVKNAKKRKIMEIKKKPGKKVFFDVEKSFHVFFLLFYHRSVVFLITLHDRSS